MTDHNTHSALVTTENPALSELKLSWRTVEFTAEDGVGPLASLHEAGDALVAVARMEEEGLTILGSGVMVGPGLLLTATHVLDEFSQEKAGPVFLTFLPGASRAWLPQDAATISAESEFDETRKVVSDLSLVSCTLNSAAHEEFPLMLAPMQVALPLIGERLWAIGFRHQDIKDCAARVTPMISSGLVTAAFPHGRGERMASPCFEVNMDTVGGMSGGAVVNSDGYLVGIVSSSFEGGPSYVTLIWEAIRLGVKGTVPKLATQESVSLLSAKALGLVKLKGKVDSRPFAVTFTFSDEESKLFADSIPPPVAGADRKPGLSAEQLEAFIDEWGGFMEEMAGDAAIDALEALSLSKMREFLEISRIPANCLEAIHGFSVEDFEGVEDFSITSTAVTGDVQLSIAYYFELPTLIWTVEVDDDLYQVNKDDFLKHFFNAETEDGVVTMEVAQRGYFEGTMMFDRDQEQFIDVSIISSAIRRPPLVVPDR
ncbi:serine protease [Bradyrhizobium sp. Cp5.3]|uniref:trypsin-like serine peptidase n=1 Tax=Bradyrhizobium sp. Cp5.3 TaxID=443598 RepID=UPI0004210458|nr:serine protease [Bradyrhizobium sp. Cp5.3]